MRRIVLSVAVITALISALLASPARAVYIGREGKLAFVRANQIYSVANSGGTVKKLTSSGKNYRPKWSPDGKRIAYIHETTTGARDVWVMFAGGGTKTRVTTVGNVTTNPTWTPSGRQIFFGAGTGNVGSPVWYVNANKPFGSPAPLMGRYFGCEGCEEILEDNPIEQMQADRFLAWSPDGKSLAIFNGADGHLDRVIYLYDAATQVANYLTGFQDHETLMSDMAFGATGQLGYGAVYVQDLPAPTSWIVYPGFASVNGDRAPAPSPSNVHMALTNNASGTANIYTTTITGTQRKLIVANGYQPDWQSLH